MPVPYAISNGVPMLADRKMPASKDQIESKESKIIEFEKREYRACHIILSTMLICLGPKIKALKTAEDMWKQSSTGTASYDLRLQLQHVTSISLVTLDGLKLNCTG